MNLNLWNCKELFSLKLYNIGKALEEAETKGNHRYHWVTEKYCNRGGQKLSIHVYNMIFIRRYLNRCYTFKAKK